MKKTVLLIFLFLALFGCNQSQIQVTGVKPKANGAAAPTPTPASGPLVTVTNVNVTANQLVISGTDLNTATSVRVTGPSGFDQTFAIESQSSGSLIANSLSNLSILADGLFSLIISNAYGAATYSINFQLQDGQVTAAKLNAMGASAGDVLTYDGSSWGPAPLTGLTYKGTFDASSVADQTTVGAAAGHYYIVTTAGTNDPDGTNNGTTFSIGDWAVFNGATSQWDKVIGTNDVVSVAGKQGVVTLGWADFSKTGSLLSDIANVDVSGRADGDILVWENATSKWVVKAPVDTNTNAATLCSGSQVLLGDGSCVALPVDTDTNTNAATICNAGEYLDGDGTCKTAATTVTSLGVDQITSGSGLFFTYEPDGTACGPGQILVWNNITTRWECGNKTVDTDTNTNAGTLCNAGEYLDGDGTCKTVPSGADNLGNHTAGQNITLGTHYLSGDGGDEGLLIDASGNVTASAALILPADQPLRWGASYVIANGGDNNIRFHTNGTERMRLNGANLGVGTTTPGQKLSVKDGNILIESDSPAELQLKTYRDSNNQSRLFGYGARGTAASPTASAGSDIMLDIRGFTYNGSGHVFNTRIELSNDGAQAVNDTPSRIDFSTTPSGTSSPTKRLSINSSGNVGIGTTSPSVKLHIADTASDNVGMRFQDNDKNWFLSSSTNEGFGVYEDSTGSTPPLFIEPGGNVGLGITNPTQKLTVAGSINVTTGSDICIDGSGCLSSAISGGGETNTASNIGTAGVGVFKQKTSANLEFKKINSDGSLTITDDTGNNEVDITVNSVNVDKIASGAGLYLDYLPNNVACTNNQVLQWDLSNSRWICGDKTVDTNTTYSAGNGIDSTSIAGGTVALNLASGSGLTFSTGQLATDNTVLQSRVTGTCAAGSSINAINADGTVTCETDDTGSAVWSVNGNDAYYSTGNVGIGTASPSGYETGTGSRYLAIQGTNGSSEIVIRHTGSSLGHAPALSFASGANRIAYIRTQKSGTGTQDANLDFGTSDGTTLSTKMRISKEGNVGIGTTNPGVKLEVVGDDESTAMIVKNSSSTAGRIPGIKVENYNGGLGGYPAIDLTNARGSESTPAATQAADPTGLFQFWGSDGTTTRRVASIGAYAQSNTTGTSAEGFIQFNTTGLNSVTPTEKMRLGSNGQLSLNQADTQNTYTFLEVDTNMVSNRTATMRFLKESDVEFAKMEVFNGHSGGASQIRFGVNGFTPLVMNGGTVSDTSLHGNVGVGDTNPIEQLTVGGVTALKETTAPSATTNYGKLYVKSSDSKLYFMDDAGVETDLIAGGTVAGISSTADANAITIDSSERVGIGTASPSEKLEVVGTVKATAGNLWSSNGSTGTTRALLLENYDDTANTNGVDVAAKLGGTEFQGLSWTQDTAWTSASVAADKDASLSFGVLKDNVATNPMTLTSDGFLGIGLSDPTEQITIEGDGVQAAIGVNTFRDVSSGSKISLRQSRGSRSVKTASQAGDYAIFEFRSYDGSTFGTSAEIRGGVDATATAGSTPGRMRFFTAPTGSLSGVERMRIDSAGNVGINEPSPDEMLHVTKDNAGGKTSIKVENPNTAASSKAEFYALGGSTYLVNQAQGDGYAYTLSNAANGYGLGTFANSDLIFYTNSSEAMRISAGGNLGIGTLTPSQKLDVNGTVKATAFVGDGSGLTSISASPAGADSQIQFNNGGSLGASTGLQFSSSQGSLFLHTKPTSWGSGYFYLNDQSDSRTGLQLNNSSTGANTSSDGFDIAMVFNRVEFNLKENDYMSFSTNNTERLRIGASGNVGIGTTNPSGELLEVAGNIVIGSDRSNSTIKTGALKVPNYDNTKADVGLMYLESKSIVNNLKIGSGGTSTTGATDIAFHTYTNNWQTVSGAERMRIDSSGYIGIGTSSPSSLLDVEGAAATLEINATSGNSALKVNSLAGDRSTIALQKGGASRWLMESEATAEGGSNAGSNFALRSYDDAGSFIGTPLWVTRATGFVGVGATAPAANLEVERAGTPTQPIALFDDNAAAHNNSDVVVEAFRPGYVLRDTTTSASDFRMGLDTEAVVFSFDTDEDEAKTASSHYDDKVAMRVQSDGKVTIGGDVAPNETLHIYNNSGVEGTNGIFIQDPSAGGTNGGSVYYDDRGGLEGFKVAVSNASTETGYIYLARDSGRVGVGTGSPDQVFSVNGEASKTGGGSWATFSDARLKTITGDFDKGLSILRELNPITYFYNKDNPAGINSNEEEHVGFIAQEVQVLIPEAVTETDSGFLQLNNDPILWTMLNAVQELDLLFGKEMNKNLAMFETMKGLETRVEENSRAIASLENEVEELKEENEKLKAQNAKLEERLKKIEKALGLE